MKKTNWKLLITFIMLVAGLLFVGCGDEELPKIIIPTGAEKLARDLNTLFQVNSRFSTGPQAICVDNSVYIIDPDPPTKIVKPVVDVAGGKIEITIPSGVTLFLDKKNMLVLSKNADSAVVYTINGAGTLQVKEESALTVDGVTVYLSGTITLELSAKDALVLDNKGQFIIRKDVSVSYVNESIKKIDGDFKWESGSFMTIGNGQTVTELPGGSTSPARLTIEEGAVFAPETDTRLNDVIVGGSLKLKSASPVTIQGTLTFATSGYIEGTHLIFSEKSKIVGLLAKEGPSNISPIPATVITSSPSGRFEDISGSVKKDSDGITGYIGDGSAITYGISAISEEKPLNGYIQFNRKYKHIFNNNDQSDEQFSGKTIYIFSYKRTADSESF